MGGRELREVGRVEVCKCGSVGLGSKGGTVCEGGGAVGWGDCARMSSPNTMGIIGVPSLRPFNLVTSLQPASSHEFSQKLMCVLVCVN